MTSQPAMSGTAVRSALVRWLWLIVVLALVCGAAAYYLASRSHPTYTANAQVTYTPIVQGTDGRTNSQVATAQPLNNTDKWSPAVFVNTDAANAAAAASGIPASKILHSLVVTPVSPTQVQLAVSGPNRQAAVRATNAYTAAWVKGKSTQATAAIVGDVATIRSTLPSVQGTKLAGLLHGLLNSLKQLRGDVPTLISYQPAIAAGISGSHVKPSLAALAGALAGAAAGILIAVLIARGRARVGNGGELAELGLAVVEIDTSAARSAAEALRLELEIAGISRDLSVVSISPLPGEPSASAAAVSLAEEFARTGTSTVVITSTFGHGAHGPGLSGYLAAPDGATADLARVAPNLLWMSAGDPVDVWQHLTAPSLQRLLDQCKSIARVVILEIPAAVAEPHSMLAVACAEVAVVVSRRSTPWRNLAATLRAMQRAALSHPPVICIDRSSTDKLQEERLTILRSSVRLSPQDWPVSDPRVAT